MFHVKHGRTEAGGSGQSTVDGTGGEFRGRINLKFSGYPNRKNQEKKRFIPPYPTLGSKQSDFSRNQRSL